MEGVGPRLSDHVDHRAGVLSILSAKVTGLNTEFLEGVGIRKRLVDIGVLVNVIPAV